MMQVIFRWLHWRALADPPLPVRVGILLAAIITYGAAGFLYFELPGTPDLAWADAFWFAMVTMTTVGYGDFFPKTVAGRYLVGVPLMLVGIGLLGYVLSTIATALITARMRERQGMGTTDARDHVLIFNFPGESKVARILAELARDPGIGPHVPVVIVDERLDALPAAIAATNVRFIRGNPVREETLSRAGLARARHALILAADSDDPHSDALTLATVLAIETRHRGVNTIAECVDPESIDLLRRAGCNHIVCGSRLDACLVSQELLNPGAIDVLEELASNAHGQQLYITPLRRAGAATYADVMRAALTRGHLALGLRRGTSSLLNVAPATPLDDDDMLISIGPRREADFAV